MKMMAKVKRILISPEALLRMMAVDTGWRVIKGVPEDARFRGVTLDPYANVINLFVEHESFPEIDEGEVAPFMENEFRRIL